jgi:carbamate kinase
MSELLRSPRVRQFGSGRPLIVVALGGNALMQPDEDGSLQTQAWRAAEAAAVFARIVKRGYRILLVHGNGPQVGQDLIRSEAASAKLPLVPLDACVAATQGTMGYQLELALHNTGRAVRVATVMTLIEVGADDPGFAKPTKPVGPFLPEHRARELQQSLQWPMVEDSGRGWRKVVASPVPVGVVNVDALDAVMSRMDIVVAGGGGGVPVVRSGGQLAGVEAVIDKDLTSALLGQVLGAHMMLVLTAVDHIALDFGKPTQRALKTMTVADAEQHMADGQFPPGSMGPKVRAALEFTRATGHPAAIGSIGQIAQILRGRSGTRITP